ncbi:MAG: PAP2 superfamily protein [Syntrophorhabdaceae bacterium PtaU1.Bin034]|nr:MAG: PAP2 superfamily protein [Syntrophorhabdaceae bacterium PtaU1.Bin034]
MIERHPRLKAIIAAVVILVMTACLFEKAAVALDPVFLNETDMKSLRIVTHPNPKTPASVEGAPAGREGSSTAVKASRPGAGSKPAPGESFFSKDYFGLLLEDTTHVLTAPARWEKKEWITFSLAALGVGAAVLLDKPVWDMIQRNETQTSRDIADVVGLIGSGYNLAVPVTFYIVGEASDNTKAKVVALDSLAASMIAAGIIHPVLKIMVGRSAPRDDEGTLSFRPFDLAIDKSFPSGHAAQCFALASVISAHYNETWVKATSHSIASVASLARVYQGEHFLSDWVAGALIGAAVGNAVFHFNEHWRREKKQQNVFLLPLVGRSAVGLTVSLRTDAF